MLTPDELKAKMERKFPRDAKTWNLATDEPRDMSRVAREIRGLDESHAADFRSIHSPAEWNKLGIDTTIAHYTAMTERERKDFCGWFDVWLPNW